jgi:hypothetical protein
MLRPARRLCGFALLLSVISAPVCADPIVITSGSAFLPWDGERTTVTLRGEGLSLVGVDVAGGGVFTLPSGPASIDGGLSFSTFSSAIGSTRFVVVGGTLYEAYLNGSLNFDVIPVEIPPASAGSVLTLSAPFTAAGRLFGTSEPLGRGSVLFDVLLTGRGTATVQADAVDTNLFRTGGVFYEFAEAPAATPEPATLLLMGTGIAGVLLRRRHAR